MAENATIEAIITDEELDKLTHDAGAQIQEDREALAHALGEDVEVIPQYQSASPQNEPSLKESAAIDARIAELEEQFNTKPDKKVKDELDALFQEQEALRNQVEDVTIQQPIQETKRKKNFLEKLFIRMVFSATKPLNEPLERLRRIAVDQAMEERKEQGKYHGRLASTVKMMSIMRRNSTELIKQITPVTSEPHR